MAPAEPVVQTEAQDGGPAAHTNLAEADQVTGPDAVAVASGAAAAEAVASLPTSADSPPTIVAGSALSAPAPQPVVAPPPVPTEPPAPGSLADLRRRLELLPFGHPSSPYHVDGERKPPPHRLKHLELAPKAANRFAATAGAASSVTWSALPGTDDEGWPEMPVAPPTEADADEPPDGRLADADAAAPPGGQPAAPAAPRMEVDGSWSWGSARLTADQVRVAEDAYDRFRAAEGRSLFGGYGSAGLTTAMRRIAGELEFGSLAPGLEENSLIELDVFRARFADLLARYPDRSMDRLARRVPAAISYSFVFDQDRYAAGIWTVQDVLTANGFHLLARRNDWGSTSNKCVSTMWHDPVNDLPFQLQFHTTASLEAQELAKTSATLINDPRSPEAEVAHLRSDLAAAWAAVPEPPGNDEISDYRGAADGSAPR